ncbi:hypothetical protein JCM10212_004642 [Sporobolomyces blumeae]
MSDPFAANGHNTVPRGTYDTDLHAATPRPPPSVAPTATGGTRSGMTSAAGGGSATAASAPGSRSIPALSTSGRTTGTGTSSARHKSTPWYLETAWIVALIIALLIALGLGVGLGVGLGTKNNNSKSNDAVAQPDGSGDSTVTSYSTYSSVVTASASTTIVPTIVSDTRSASVVIETIGGSTVTAVQQATNGAGVQVTVSETLPPTTRTNVVYVTTYPSTQTLTTTLQGGAAATVFETVTIRRTVTALATARARARRDAQPIDHEA